MKVNDWAVSFFLYASVSVSNGLSCTLLSFGLLWILYLVGNWAVVSFTTICAW